MKYNIHIASPNKMLIETCAPVTLGEYIGYKSESTAKINIENNKISYMFSV